MRFKKTEVKNKHMTCSSCCFIMVCIAFATMNHMACAQTVPKNAKVRYTLAARTQSQLRDFGMRMRIEPEDSTWLKPFSVHLDYQGSRAVSYLAADGDDQDVVLKASVFTGVGPYVSWWQERDTAYLYKVGTPPLMDRNYLVVYPYRALAEAHTDWELINEQKAILGYICKKALRREYQYVASKDTLTETEVVAWYCPDLPYPHGPAQYGGLPGLILEVHGSRTIFTAVDIVIPDDISVPDLPEGERINPKAYAITSSDAYHRFMEMIKKN